MCGCGAQAGRTIWSSSIIKGRTELCDRVLYDARDVTCISTMFNGQYIYKVNPPEVDLYYPTLIKFTACTRLYSQDDNLLINGINTV